MAKPATFDGYTDQYTVDCERVLVTLLRGLGPWKESVYLVGGLTPRYLVLARPPAVPAHAGTLDVDIVIDLQILADTAGYSTLEDNLRGMRFERSTNDKGQKLSWRWQTRTEHGALMVVELLADAPEIAGGKVEPLPTKGTISALNIPHSSIVFDLHQVTAIQAELLNGAGTAVEQVKHANLVSFTCLKAFAFDQSFERKDAHDLVYCIEHAPEGLDSAAEIFRNTLEGGHGTVIWNALAILRNRFTQDQNAALGTLLNYWNNFDQPLLNCFDSITSPTCSLPVIPVIQQRPLFASHSGHPGKNHRATGGHREGKPELK